jgi:hypothetical protein
MARALSGIEVTAHCPVLMSQNRVNKVEIEIDGAEHQVQWDAPQVFEVSPGRHRIRARLRGLLMNGPYRSLEIDVEAGQVAEVGYSLTMLSLVNSGKLELKGKRPAPSVGPASARKCPSCSAPVPADARFCPQCAAPLAG